MQTSRGANQQSLGLWLPPCKKVCYKDKGKTVGQCFGILRQSRSLLFPFLGRGSDTTTPFFPRAGGESSAHCDTQQPWTGWS